MREGPIAACPPASEPPALVPRRSRDGSFSLFSEQFGEGFHCADGALAEARRVFVAPAQLERFAVGSRLRVVEVAVGTGTNTAALVQACQERGLALDWWGLELDRRPLQLALADDGFRRQWPGPVLAELEGLCSGERLLWGDGRARLSELLARLEGRCDLVLHDGFSPRHCPQLWSQEFLGDLAGLLAPEGRLLTYCSAAAVRQALVLAGLQLAAICAPDGSAIEQPNTTTSAMQARAGTNSDARPEQGGEASRDRGLARRTDVNAHGETTGWDDGRGEADRAAISGAGTSSPTRVQFAERAEATAQPLPEIWSAGTVASPTPLPSGGVLRSLSPMEREHLACRAGEPYRDHSLHDSAAEILERRQRDQGLSAAEPSSHWQRRWGLARRHRHPRQAGSQLPLNPRGQIGAEPSQQPEQPDAPDGPR